jgi:RNA polymerase sigma-70 factor (ECF subfamily)
MTEDNLTSRFFALSKRLRLSAKRLLGSGEDADDALQDFFVKLWSKRENNAEELSDALMATMMRNQCIDTLRRRAARGNEVDIDEMREVISLADTSETDELYSEVQQIIDSSLSDLQRQILMLHDMQEMEYDDISRQLDMSVVAVRTHVCRARNTIRTIYRERNLSSKQKTKDYETYDSETIT